jgi:hypothetical protein
MPEGSANVANLVHHHQDLTLEASNYVGVSENTEFRSVWLKKTAKRIEPRGASLKKCGSPRYGFDNAVQLTR